MNVLRTLSVILILGIAVSFGSAQMPFNVYKTSPRPIPPRPAEQLEIVCISLPEIAFLLPRIAHRFDQAPCVPAWMRDELRERRDYELTLQVRMQRTA